MLLSIIRSHGADIGTVLMYILSILIIIFLVNPLHECAHGFVAYKLGDRTAKNMGRLTLNPMAHLDYFGAIMMLIVGFGWAKPVPINPNNFRNYRRDYILVSLAGIFANLLVFLLSTVITVLIYKYAEARWLSYVFQFFLMLAQMNLSLAIFNLLPVPPLDGYRFLDHFIFKGNLSMNRQTMQIIQIVFLVVCISGLLNGLLSTVNSNIFNAVFRFVFRIL